MSDIPPGAPGNEEKKEKPKLRGVWFMWVRNRACECWPQIVDSDGTYMPEDIAKKQQLPDGDTRTLEELIKIFPCPPGEINGQEQTRSHGGR